MASFWVNNHKKIINNNKLFSDVENSLQVLTSQQNVIFFLSASFLLAVCFVFMRMRIWESWNSRILVYQKKNSVMSTNECRIWKCSVVCNADNCIATVVFSMFLFFFVFFIFTNYNLFSLSMYRWQQVKSDWTQHTKEPSLWQGYQTFNNFLYKGMNGSMSVHKNYWVVGLCKMPLSVSYLSKDMTNCRFDKCGNLRRGEELKFQLNFILIEE